MLKKLCIIFVFSFQGIVAQGKFLLIMGPSGAGKSTVINHLKKLDARFKYVKPFTTRKLRDGEQDKIHVSLKKINTLNQSGKLLAINKIYGIYYATPKEFIDHTLKQNQFPILDWPIEKLHIMQTHYPNQIYTVYIQPDNLEELKQRLSHDNRDKDGKRYEAGIQEINNLIAGKYDQLIDLKLINKKNYAQETAQVIYAAFLNSLKETKK